MDSGLGYRYLVSRERTWRIPAAGAALFLATSLAWLIPAALIGAGGLPQYLQTVADQWSVAVRESDVTQLTSPWLVSLAVRIERFVSAYYLAYPWTGGDNKTAMSLALVAPWALGSALFVVSFRVRDPGQLFLALWILTISYPVLAIHFLPRYGLPYFPAFMMASLMGFRFLASGLLWHPRRLEVLSAAGIGAVLILYGLKYQAPVGAFEASPPGLQPLPSAFFATGALLLALGRWLYVRDGGSAPDERMRSAYARVVMMGALALLVVPYAVRGYSSASIAHQSYSPSQRVAELVEANFRGPDTSMCTGLQTEFILTALREGGRPSSLSTPEELAAWVQAGGVALVTDRCPWYGDITRSVALSEVAHFQGASPLWAKAPAIRLLMASTSTATGR